MTPSVLLQLFQTAWKQSNTTEVQRDLLEIVQIVEIAALSLLKVVPIGVSKTDWLIFHSRGHHRDSDELGEARSDMQFLNPGKVVLFVVWDGHFNTIEPTNIVEERLPVPK